MLTVACVLSPSKDYDVEYVTRLKASVEAHLKQPHGFVCLSSVEVPCDRIPLVHCWHGWWSKLELFRLPPPVLYFDLDTMPVGDLSEIAAQAVTLPFVALRDFYREDRLGSGMMSWAIGMEGLYDTFVANPPMWQDKHRKSGDQGFIEEQVNSALKWQDVLPGQVVSYKAHVRGNGVPENARVVCFHGRPRPADIAWTL